MNKRVFLGGLVLLCALVISQGQSQAQGGPWPAPLLNADDPYWPSFGYDQQNTSRSPHPGPGPGPVEIAWTYPAVKGRVINQQPTVDTDGTVYFATWGSYVEGTGDRARGMLYAVNPDGTEKWVFDPGPLEGYYLGTIETAATIGPGGTIYIGRGDGILRAVNPDGSEKWTFETYANQYGRAQIFSSPVIAEDGTIYFGTGVYKALFWTLGTNVLYALNPDGSVKWTYPEDAAEGGSLDDQIFMNPAIGHDGTVYFSSGFTTYALNPDGTERWRKTTIRNMWNTAVGEDGTVYVQAMYKAGGTGAIYALNPEDGSRKWMYAVEEPTVTKVAIVGNGTLYFGSGTHETSDEPQNVGKLYAIVDCGQNCVEEKWTEPVDFGSSVGTPTIDAEGTIYVALRGDTSPALSAGTSTRLSAGLGMAGDEADPPVPGQVVAVRDLGESAEILWSVEATGEIWQGNPVIGPNRTLYFADAVCIHDPATGTDCDAESRWDSIGEDTQIPSLYAVKPATPPESQCVQDVNANGVGDVVDVQATATKVDCLVYLPLVAANWREPWPTATPTPAPTSEAFQLQHVRTVTLTTDEEGAGARPELVFSGGRFFVVYLGNIIPGSGDRAFKVKVFDQDFTTEITARDLVTPSAEYGGPTDIRVTSDGQYLYAFYEVAGPQQGAHLFAAKYALTNDFPRVAYTAQPIATGPYWHDAQFGDETLDDPAPVLGPALSPAEGPDAVFVMTKLRTGITPRSETTYRLRELTTDLVPHRRTP